MFLCVKTSDYSRHESQPQRETQEELICFWFPWRLYQLDRLCLIMSKPQTLSVRQRPSLTRLQQSRPLINCFPLMWTDHYQWSLFNSLTAVSMETSGYGMVSYQQPKLHVETMITSELIKSNLFGISRGIMYFFGDASRCSSCTAVDQVLLDNEESVPLRLSGWTCSGLFIRFWNVSFMPNVTKLGP